MGDSETQNVTLTADDGTCKECFTSVSTTVPGESGSQFIWIDIAYKENNIESDVQQNNYQNGEGSETSTIDSKVPDSSSEIGYFTASHFISWDG